MRRALVVLAVWAGVAWAAPPSLTWEGKLSWLAAAGVEPKANNRNPRDCDVWPFRGHPG